MKKALVANDGDMEAAVDYFKEKGVSNGAKKADRIEAEGLANIYIEDNVAAIAEINSETDFVSKTTINSRTFVKGITKTVAQNKHNHLLKSLKNWI